MSPVGLPFTAAAIYYNEQQHMDTVCSTGLGKVEEDISEKDKLREPGNTW